MGWISQWYSLVLHRFATRITLHLPSIDIASLNSLSFRLCITHSLSAPSLLLPAISFSHPLLLLTLPLHKSYLKFLAPSLSLSLSLWLSSTSLSQLCIPLSISPSLLSLSLSLSLSHSSSSLFTSLSPYLSLPLSPSLSLSHLYLRCCWDSSGISIFVSRWSKLC